MYFQTYTFFFIYLIINNSPLCSISHFFLLIFSNGSDASRKLSIVNYRLSIFLLAAFRQKKRTFFKLTDVSTLKNLYNFNNYSHFQIRLMLFAVETTSKSTSR